MTYLVTLYVSHTPFKIEDLLLFMKATVLSVLGSSSILMIHNYLMAKKRKFTMSVGIAAIGSFLGFIFIMLGGFITILFPYSQPMIALRSRALTDMTGLELFIFISINLVYSFLFFFLTMKELEKKG